MLTLLGGFEKNKQGLQGSACHSFVYLSPPLSQRAEGGVGEDIKMELGAAKPDKVLGTVIDGAKASGKQRLSGLWPWVV